MRSRCSQGGFSLTEALITVMVLGFFILILFMVVNWGFQTFSVAVSRADVTTEARRVALFIEQELRGSDYFSVAIQSQPTSSSDDRRDGVCFVSRKDWAYNAYNVTEATPNFDRYFLYYATDKKPAGELVRAEIVPPTPGDVGRFPFRPFVANPSAYMLSDPTSTYPTQVAAVRVLASSIKRFEVSRSLDTQEIDIKILLRQNGLVAKRVDGRRLGGTFEIHYKVHPENTN